jgi:hypothetical protein
MNERLKKILMMDYATKNQGGGLFGNQNQGGLFGNLANINPNLLIGANIAGAGFKGQEPFGTIMPSVLQAAKIKQAFRGKSKLIKAKNKKTGANVFVEDIVVKQNPELYEPIQTKMFETTEQKNIGETFGKEFANIYDASTESVKNLGTLDTLSELVKIDDLKLGIAGNLRTNAEKIANELGLDFDWQNVGAAEVLGGVSGQIVLEGLANFKGAISDGERKFLIDITPGLTTSRAGNEALIAVKKRADQHNVAFADIAKEWVDTYGGLSKKNADGMTWNQFKSAWHESNPLLTPELKDQLTNLSKTFDTEFSNQIVDGKDIGQPGKQFTKIGGIWYEIN